MWRRADRLVFIILSLPSEFLIELVIELGKPSLKLWFTPDFFFLTYSFTLMSEKEIMFFTNVSYKCIELLQNPWCFME